VWARERPQGLGCPTGSPNKGCSLLEQEGAMLALHSHLPLQQDLGPLPAAAWMMYLPSGFRCRQAKKDPK